MEEDYNQGGSAAQDRDFSDSFLKLMIEVESDLQKFEMETLRRKRLKINIKNNTKEWMPMGVGIKSICNDLGITEILGQMRGRATTIGRLTKKTDQEVATDLHQFHRTMIELFELRADEWELDEELLKPLLEACIGFIQDVVFSSRNGFSAINAKSQYSRHETFTGNSNEQQPRSILGLGRGRR